MERSKKLSLEKQKIKILLFENIHPNAAQVFIQAGYSEIINFKEALDMNNPTHLAYLKTAHFIGIRSVSKFNKNVFLHAERLAALGCFCIGTNQVDLDMAASQGIPVFNAPYSNTRSVAELVLGELILLLRKIPEKNKLCHEGVWQKTAHHSFEVRGKVLGIIGYGHIGSQLGVLAEALGMQVIFYDIEPKLALGNAKFVPLDFLLKNADVISCHVPETSETEGLINQERLALMKKTAVLINASRGKVVDIEALTEALKSGFLLGAGIDVFPKEPGCLEEKFESSLKNIPNVLLTPHIGGSTQEAQENIGFEVAEKLVKYSDNGSTLSAVNFPEVSLPSKSKHTRLMHVHLNKPGVMTAINEVLFSRDLNIAGQYLQTSMNIGYVVIDIDTQLNLEEISLLKSALSKIPYTIKTRVLLSPGL